MTKTKVYCDHCDKELDIMKDYIETEINLYCSYFNTDLCSDCYDELNKIVKEFCQKQ